MAGRSLLFWLWLLNSLLCILTNKPLFCSFIVFKKLNDSLEKTIRITVTNSEYEGYQYLKVFSPLASKREMMKKLKEYTSAEKIITFGSIEDEYDVYYK